MTAFILFLVGILVGIALCWIFKIREFANATWENWKTRWNSFWKKPQEPVKPV